ncbi:MAG: aminomethyltransferase family protein [Planctomycetota bacterium]
MPVPTPFHPRTSTLSKSLLYKEWAGYFAVCSYETCHEREYYAFRHSAGLLDVTPLYKYEVRGPDASRLLSRICVRGFIKQKVGAVAYVCWCDSDGHVLDDGTVTRLDDQHYRMTSADPALRWLRKHSRGLDVELEDVSAKVAALALQGPRAREVLRPLVGAELDELGFFRVLRTRFDGHELTVTRTGYTGDLGYELWIENAGALALWDALMEAGAPHGLLPVGLDALDVTRIEAGFLLKDVDYFSAKAALIPQHKSTPFELGFDWMVKLDRDPFVGQAALRRAAERGPQRKLIGFEVDWDRLEELFDEHGLPPEVPAGASRAGTPIYHPGTSRFIGQATSRAWSPVCKAFVGLATVEAEYAEVGTELDLEVTVEYRRTPCRARVVARPFFDPDRKKG